MVGSKVSSITAGGAARATFQAGGGENTSGTLHTAGLLIFILSISSSNTHILALASTSSYYILAFCCSSKGHTLHST